MAILVRGVVAGGEKKSNLNRKTYQTLPDLTLEARVRLAEFVALRPEL